MNYKNILKIKEILYEETFYSTILQYIYIKVYIFVMNKCFIKV